MALLLSPPHNANLMVGHGEGHLLLKDPTRVGIKLFRDINSTGDGTSSMDFGPQLVCLSDLRSQGTHYIMSLDSHQQQQMNAMMQCIESMSSADQDIGEVSVHKAVVLTQAGATVHKEEKWRSSLSTQQSHLRR